MVRKTKGKPTDLDIIIGKNLRKFRTFWGISQEKLGAKVDITFQQIQKYEHAQNRISASRLYEFSQILNVPLAQFYGDLKQVTDDGQLIEFTGEDLRILKKLNKPEHKGLKAYVQSQVL